MDFYAYRLVVFLSILIFILAFVSIVMWFKKQESAERTKLIMNAMEKGQSLDPALLQQKPRMFGSLFMYGMLGCGVGLTVFGILSGAIVLYLYNFAQVSYLDDLFPITVVICLGVALIVTYVAIKNAQSKKSADETKQK